MYKRRKMEHISLFEPLLTKRKMPDEQFFPRKRMRETLSVKTKRSIDNNILNTNKKQKVCNIHCLIHIDEYICNIYECSGIKEHHKSFFMPYIN